MSARSRSSARRRLYLMMGEDKGDFGASVMAPFKKMDLRTLYDSVHSDCARQVLFKDWVWRHDANEWARQWRLEKRKPADERVYSVFWDLNKVIQRQTLFYLRSGKYPLAATGDDEHSAEDHSAIDAPSFVELKIEDQIAVAKSTRMFKILKPITTIAKGTEEKSEGVAEISKKSATSVVSTKSGTVEGDTIDAADVSTVDAAESGCFAKYGCEVFVTANDCIDVGHWLLKRGLNPAVLNMANARSPGGGFTKGSSAQEESLMRRSSLVCALRNTNWFTSECSHGEEHCECAPHKLDEAREWKYPIPEFGAIHTPNVSVFRGNCDSGYPLLKEPFEMAFITAAMYYLRRGESFSELLRAKAAEKWRAVLRLGFERGHNALVLSAWGCGAFHNPPEAHASIVDELLRSDEFRGRFKAVVFAIFDDHNSGPRGNFQPFADVFGTRKIALGP